MPIYHERKNLNDKHELGLKWCNIADLIQVKTPSSLIQIDLEKGKEENCLNNYQELFSDASVFVVSQFFIPVRNSINNANTD
jgi:hypothetical protein